MQLQYKENAFTVILQGRSSTKPRKKFSKTNLVNLLPYSFKVNHSKKHNLKAYEWYYAQLRTRQ